MPTYTYRCDPAGHQFETVQRFSDDPLTECPTCGEPIRRVIQPVGVVFKGSGWYITDSRAPQKDGAEAEPKTAATADAGPGKDGSTTKESGSSNDSGPAKEMSPVAAEKKPAKPVAKAAAE
ncbi:MAG: hypothetical protein H0V24_11320 [Chloroflexia bacterium]|nr:hypothetical protein [Chloroflexia bacterium]MDQ3413146.1 hypothetical protein [Chloroflexota bacterium]